jgi:sulfur carrier protein
VTRLVVNGEPVSMPAGCSVDDLVESIGCGRKGVAVAVNADVVPRSAWASTRLADGDTVEVLHAVQGGCA